MYVYVEYVVGWCMYCFVDCGYVCVCIVLVVGYV